MKYLCDTQPSLRTVSAIVAFYFLIVLGAYLIIPSLVAVDAYYDESESAIAWFLFVALSGNIGLFLYAFDQRDSDTGVRNRDGEVVLSSNDQDD